MTSQHRRHPPPRLLHLEIQLRDRQHKQSRGSEFRGFLVLSIHELVATFVGNKVAARELQTRERLAILFGLKEGLERTASILASTAPELQP